MNKSHRLLITLCVGLGVILTVLVASPSVTRSAPTAISPAAQVLGIANGAHVVPTYNYGNEIASVNSLIGKNLALVMYFTDFSNASGDGKPFNDFLMRMIRQQLPQLAWPVMVISWMPENGRQALGCDRDYAGGIPPASIAAGACDTYLRNYARGIKARSERVILRFAFEMSLVNSKYWPFHFGQGPNDFIAMWRHVHSIFKAEGVTNVEWLWAPSFDSNPREPWNDSHLYYPGDNYVDWVGPDGYNWWYGQNPAWAWVWFDDIFLTASKDFACRYAKPQIIHEVSSADGPGTPNKVSWIQDSFQQMPKYPFLRGFLWLNNYAFNTPGMADFRVTSSTALDGGVGPVPSHSNQSWTTAYKNGLASSVYKSSLPSLAASTPPTTYCGNGEPAYTLNPRVVFLEPGESSTHTLVGMLYTAAANLSLTLPAQITGAVTPNQLPLPWGMAQVQLHTSPTTAPGTYTVTVNAGGVPLTITVHVLDSVNRVYLPLARY